MDLYLAFKLSWLLCWLSLGVSDGCYILELCTWELCFYILFFWYDLGEVSRLLFDFWVLPLLEKDVF